MDLYIVSGRTALLVALPGALWLPVNQLPESPRITPNIEVVSVLGRWEAGDRLIEHSLEAVSAAIDLRQCTVACADECVISAPGRSDNAKQETATIGNN